MLPRIRRLYHFSRYVERTYTTASTSISTDTSPSPLHTQTFTKARGLCAYNSHLTLKVKQRVFPAYPFRLDPWDAQGLMDAASLAMNLRIRAALFYHWQYAGAGPFVQLLTQIQKRRTPLRVKALYFPAWNLSASYFFNTMTQKATIVRMTLHP